MKQPTVYILANKKNGTLYTGVTSDLVQRVYQHKQLKVSGFSKRYNCTKLVYYQHYETMIEAISAEKKLKGGSRKHKIFLIENSNVDWLDLYEFF